MDPIRLDIDRKEVWRGEQPVKLTPKAFAVLRHLIAHPDKLITKDELLRTVWAGTVVSEWSLSTCIREIRRELHDDARTPRYIETVHRRGYRFIGPHLSHRPFAATIRRVASAPTTIGMPEIVGREKQLEQLYGWLGRALGGERQIVFVTGEAGIGKTTLVEYFLSQLAPDQPLWIGRGQCIEQYGGGEAYLPVLDALGQMARNSPRPDQHELVAVLTQYAPSWLIHLPSLLDRTELEALQRKIPVTTQERMLREMAGALEALTAQHGLILWLEDLHWSDYATLDLLAYLARRAEPARLLVIGTYRPVDLVLQDHPLRRVKQELQIHRQCVELPLPLLSAQVVERYVSQRFQPGKPPADFSHLIYSRTEGNPLFMVSMVDDCVRQGLLIQAKGGWGYAHDIGTHGSISVPDNIRQMIEFQLDRLCSEEQRVLEAASVAGASFSAAAVAAGIGRTVGEIEDCCSGLVRQAQFVRQADPPAWPDGTVAAGYQFRHAMYQDIIYGRLSAGRREQLHARIGLWLEQVYGLRAGEVAAELAVHFERGGEWSRAVQSHYRAGELALSRSAYREAIAHLTDGLALLSRPLHGHKRHDRQVKKIGLEQELKLQIALGSGLVATRGYGAPEVQRAYARARQLAEEIGDDPQLFPALFGLWVFYMGRAECQTAYQLATQLLKLADKADEPVLLLRAYCALGAAEFSLGHFVAAQTHLEQGLALHDSEHCRLQSPFYGLAHPTVACLYWAALLQWLRGFPDRAQRSSAEALAVAQDLSHSFSLSWGLQATAFVHQLRREGRTVQHQAETEMQLCEEQGFVHFLSIATILRGWAVAERGQPEEGLTDIQDGLTQHRSSGARVWYPYWLLLAADTHRKRHAWEAGLQAIADAQSAIRNTGERWCEAELHRLKGEILLGQATDPERASLGAAEAIGEAEACFRHAIHIAHSQGATAWELRATMSLSRLLLQHGKRTEVGHSLRQIYSQFSEGFDSADLHEAKELLGELS